MKQLTGRNVLFMALLFASMAATAASNKPVGQSCKVDADCKTNVCEQSVCKYERKANVDQAKKATGMTCSGDSECKTGICSQHVCKSKR